MVSLPLHTWNFWILFKIRPFDLLQALSVLAQPSVSTLRQVSPPLRFRHLTLTAKFLTTTLQYRDLPVFQRVFNPSPRDKTHNLRYNLEKSLVRSFKFHCISILPTVPPWLSSSPNIILSLTKPNSPKDRPHSSCIDLIFKKSSTLILTLSATRMAQKLKIGPVLPFQSTTASKLTVSATTPPRLQRTNTIQQCKQNLAPGHDRIPTIFFTKAPHKCP